MEKTTTTVETVKHVNVYGRELLYIRMSRMGKEVVINVGEKTFANVNELLQDVESKVMEKITDTKEVKAETAKGGGKIG